MNKNITKFLGAFIFLLLLSCNDNVQIGGVSVFREEHKSDTLISNWLRLADYYMDTEYYDSAQLWLNKIHERHPIKATTIKDYTILSRQAEVYYYNNLHQLGLQEIERALAIAKVLKDSFLLADSYNFLGLFFTNMDSLQKANDAFNKAVRYTRQHTNPSSYPPLSNPHHVFGNRAELFFKNKNYESARKDYHHSIQLANEIHAKRGEAVAYYGLGETFQQLKAPDSTSYYFQKSQQIANTSKDVDIELIAFSGLALSSYSKNKKSEALLFLNKGSDLLDSNPGMNHYYSLRFLTQAIEVLEFMGDQRQLIRMIQKKSDIETSNIGSGNIQIQQILTAGLNNEKRIAGLEITGAQQKQRLANGRLVFVVFLLIVLMISFFVYRYFQNQRHAVALIRQKLSQDLHDDIGASLSSMQIYATIAGQSLDQKPEKAREMIKKINQQSAEVMANMNDIVWSMKTTEGSNASFSLRLKNYASSFLSENDIYFTMDLFDDVDLFITGISARKNLLLIAKEAMNNIAKHSSASQVRIALRKEAKHLIMEIEDNGKGIVQSDTTRGNGLNNIYHRAKELNGKSAILQVKEATGTIIQVVCPLNAIR